MTAALLLALAASGLVPPDLSVVGMIVSRDPARSVAILRSGGRLRSVSVGEAVFGGRLLAVGPDSVSLAYGDERVELRLAASVPRPLPPPVAVKAQTAAPPEDPATPVRSMDRREVERRLGEEVPRILAETTVVPVTDEGRIAGLALTRIPEGLLTDAGLRPGDILTNVNGTPIDGLATLIGLWPRLQNESELRAVVLRNGRPISLTVTLR